MIRVLALYHNSKSYHSQGHIRTDTLFQISFYISYCLLCSALKRWRKLFLLCLERSHWKVSATISPSKRHGHNSWFNSVTILLLAANYGMCGNLGIPAPFIYITDWSVLHKNVYKAKCSSSLRALPLAFGSLLLLLALFKATAYWKLDGYSGSQLVLVLVKDQAFYYIMCARSTRLLTVTDRVSKGDLLLDLQHLRRQARRELLHRIHNFRRSRKRFNALYPREPYVFQPKRGSGARRE